jgi:hypothetical protein
MSIQPYDIELTAEDEAMVLALIKDRHNASPEDRKTLNLVAKVLASAQQLKERVSTSTDHEGGANG